jgi:SAM-dependent methyltransferase
MMAEQESGAGDFDWEGRYREKTARWDFGEVVPGLADWLATQPPFEGGVAVPGCGHGHEAAAVAHAWPKAQVVGTDLSETAISEAQRLYHLPNLRLEVGDSFAHPGTQDLVAIIEHTCFCAIPPRLRPVYRDVAARRLRPGGMLVAIFYLHPEETEDEPDAGPPWGCSVPELDVLFGECFETTLSEVPQRAFPGREMRELLRVLTRR